MTHPEQIAHLAKAAMSQEPQPADAAAILVDAAALCAIECDLPVAELIERLINSHQMLAAAHEATGRHGKAATHRQ